MHPQEINNRLRKAQRFLTHIDANMPDATAATLTLLGDAFWQLLAENLGEQPPSNSTISTIIALVRGRELATEAIRASLATPQRVRS